jgi:hypothetical protein
MTAARIEGYAAIAFRPGIPLPAGTRYSNSLSYDVATDQVVEGFQVFAQYREDGTPTGRRSFVNNDGTLCGLSIAEAERERAIKQEARFLLEALARIVDAADKGADLGNPLAMARVTLRAAGGIRS